MAGKDREATALPTIQVEGKKYKAKSYRLASEKPAYEFQHLYIVEKPLMMWWQGEYQNGTFTQWCEIPEAEHPRWNKRKDAGEAKPEPQLMSEWSERAGRPADIALYYQETLKLARRWWKGKKVEG